MYVWLLILCLGVGEWCNTRGATTTIMVNEHQCRAALKLKKHEIKAWCISPTGELVTQ